MEETISFACGSCGKEVRAPASAAGKRGKCPHCGQSNLIPAPAQAADEDDDLLPLAPLDEEDERHRREELDRIFQQEQVLRTGDDEPISTPLDQRDEIGTEDLHPFVVNYCLDLAGSNLERAQAYADRLRRYGSLGKEAVAEFLDGKAIEPALDKLPARLLQGFLAQLRDELNKEEDEE